MSKEVDQKKLNRVLHLFKDKSGELKANSYKSFSAMRRTNGSLTIKLMFGYSKDKGKNPIYSEAIEIDDINLFLEFQRLLEFGLTKDIIKINMFEGLDDEY